MYTRLLQVPKKSFFLFGPRGVGKSTWLRARIPDAQWFDLLDAELFSELLADPSRLARRIPKQHDGWVVIDEVQRVPDLLNEVHRLIEDRKLRFALTGSSARAIRRAGTNLLAARARTFHMHPLTAAELGADWSLTRAASYGGLPSAWVDDDPKTYLGSYAATYLREEIQFEAITRNLSGFARFLESASFSQAGLLNMTEVARDCGIERKVVEGWFTVLEDLLVAVRLPVFTRRAKRALAAHPKFFLFDAGVYRAIRPRGPLNSIEEIDGAALETLLLAHLRALNDANQLGYELFHWRSRQGHEVDLVLYGERGLHAFEVKRSPRVRSEELRGLRAFGADYPEAKLTFAYGGERAFHDDGIDVVPLDQVLVGLSQRL